MKRSDDGTFVLDFRFSQNGEIQNTVETGNWWVENNRFFEFHEESGQTDIYSYQILDKNHIKFVSEQISIGMNASSYQFIDTRVSDKNNHIKDGSSFENAIQVKSAGEEYTFARSNCQNCSFKRQSLVFHKKRPYDILTFQDIEGKEINYYFDITSFYGKF